MKEWSKKNQFNSFNSMKGLLFKEWYQSIVDWKDGKQLKPLPPIEVSLDPIHSCNLNCEWCNASRYLSSNLKNRRMEDEHLISLVTFLGKWGAKAICFGGGGEPTLHSNLPSAIRHTREVGMESSIATNGTIISQELLEALPLCRWIGVSIDSATPETYMIGRKIDLFNKAIINLHQIVNKVKQYKTNCDVSYKFLIFAHNQHEIYDACKLAKGIGVRDFHARPADFSHQGMNDRKKVNPYNMNLIHEQFEKCHELEDENFRVYTVVHKFNEDFTPVKDFSQCFASPICIQLCANGSIYLCPDMRHKDFYKLGEHYPTPENIEKVWGNQKHYDLVFKTGREQCKNRCTFVPYNIQCEQLFINKNDPMCWKFV